MFASPLTVARPGLALVFAAPAAVADDDVERAIAAVRIKAAAGDVVAQFSLGALIYYGGDDTAQAIEWFQRAAAQGYAPAEFQMGQLHEFGFGVAPDDRCALGVVPKGRRAWQRRRPARGRRLLSKGTRRGG